MKTKIKMIALSIAMFIAGIAVACTIGRFVIMPDIAKDISKFGYETSLNGYKAGVIDCTNKNTDMYEIYFDEDVMEEINNWEYKYID